MSIVQYPLLIWEYTERAGQILRISESSAPSLPLQAHGPVERSGKLWKNSTNSTVQHKIDVWKKDQKSISHFNLVFIKKLVAFKRIHQGTPESETKSSPHWLLVFASLVATSSRNGSNRCPAQHLHTSEWSVYSCRRQIVHLHFFRPRPHKAGGKKASYGFRLGKTMEMKLDFSKSLVYVVRVIFIYLFI